MQALCGAIRGSDGLARAGEVLLTFEAASAASVDPGLEPRSLDLKGKSTPTEVVSLTVGVVPAVAT